MGLAGSVPWRKGPDRGPHAGVNPLPIKAFRPAIFLARRGSNFQRTRVTFTGHGAVVMAASRGAHIKTSGESISSHIALACGAAVQLLRRRRFNGGSRGRRGEGGRIPSLCPTP